MKLHGNPAKFEINRLNKNGINGFQKSDNLQSKYG